MKVLGISGSPRKESTTTKLIEAILEPVKFETELITLAGKDIKPCTGCLACAHDNVCKINDYAAELRQKILDADVIILGGANRFGSVNGLTNNLLERLFQFHHGGQFPLKGKLGISVGVSGADESYGEQVVSRIHQFFDVLQITKFDSISALGVISCFTCGRGHECKVSGVKNYIGSDGKLDMQYKPDLSKQPHVLEKALMIADRINNLE